MLTHLLFSIAALLFMVIFMITYFAYKKNTNSMRTKIYVTMIYFSLALAIVEIIEGITYVYNIGIIFSLMWKMHSIIMILYVAALFYYLYITIVEQTNDMEDLFWNSKKVLSIKNLFAITFVAAIILSIVYIKTYPSGLTMFYFYTNQSISFLLALYLIYILYNAYILYLKAKKNNFKTNDYVILIGTFILFVAALIFEYVYPEISIYSTLFTLVLTLIYYFKENEDLIIIEELQKNSRDLYIDNDVKLDYMHELINDLSSPLNTFAIINKELENCNDMSDEELNERLNNLNSISNNLISAMHKQATNGLSKYRIDELIEDIERIIKPSVNKKRLKFIYSIDQNIPSVLMGDSGSIERIITGLLVNAIENTDIGKISLHIKSIKQKNGILLNIKVSDSGKGIKREDFDKVFQDNMSDGNNNNLSLIKKSIDLLNGRIYFESYYGAGTTFHVSIPQSISNDIPLSQVPITNDTIQLTDAKHRKVLIVDGDEYSSKKLSNILKKYNFVTNYAKSGMEAINTIKCDEEYNLIIVTENISDIAFAEVGRILKQLRKYINVPPIIALTTNNRKYREGNFYDEYLLKPLDLKELDDIKISSSFNLFTKICT